MTTKMPTDVLSWRKEELEGAGWGKLDAELLASALEIDLHLACNLLLRGCPRDVAMDILL